MAATDIVISALLAVAALEAVVVGTLHIVKARHGRHPRWYWYTRGIAWLAIGFGLILMLKADEVASWTICVALGLQGVMAWVAARQLRRAPKEP